MSLSGTGRMKQSSSERALGWYHEGDVWNEVQEHPGR